MKKRLWILTVLFLSICSVSFGALRGNIQEREYDKFVADSSGDTTTRVTLSDSAHDTVDSAAGDVVVQMGAKAESTIPTEVSDADAVNPWYDTFGRPISKTTDLSTLTNQITDIAPAKTSFSLVTGITQLTATGDTAEQNVENHDLVGYSFTLASLEGAANVVVHLQGTLDGTNFFTLGPLENSVQEGMTLSGNLATVVSNGTYFLRVNNVKVKQVRFNWLSESSGTAAVLDVDFMAGN